jgi:hypothetical protein
MLMMVSTSAFAQSANPVPSNPSPSIPDTWQGVTASYNRGFLSCDIAGAKGIELNGFSIGYMKEFYILKSLPLFVETGLSIMYASSDEAWENLGSPFESALDDWFTDDYDKEMKTEYTYIGITLPVNLAYKFKLKDDFQLVPFAGVYMRGGVISNARCKNAGESKTYDLFNSRHAKRMGLRGAWERFQFGWQIGAKLAFGPFTLGISYSADMNEIAKKTKMRNLSFSAGYNFFY